MIGIPRKKLKTDQLYMRIRKVSFIFECPLRYYLAWFLLFLASLTLLGGCAKESDERNESQALEVICDEMLKLNFVIGDVSSMHPHSLAVGARGIALGKWLFEGLTRLNLKGSYELAGAEKLDISPCQTRYIFTLKENHYSNGALVVAQDYEKSWKEALSPTSNCLKAHLLYCIKNAEKAKKGEVSLEEVGIKAINDNTLLVELTHPTPHFLSLVSSSLFAPFKVEGNEILSSGPYKTAERKEDDYSILEANPFFWDHDHISIKKVKIFMIKDGMTAFSLYEKKMIDWIGDPFSWLSSDVTSSEIAKGNFFNETSLIYPFWLYLNTEHYPLSSSSIRQALSSVLDRNEIAKHIFVGDAPLLTPVPHALEKPLFDNALEEGRALFEAGLKELSLTKETFPTLTLSSCSLAPHKHLVEYLKWKWQEAFGIQVDLEIQEWSTFYSNLANKNYQMGGYFISCDYNDPLAALELLARKNNTSKWICPRYQHIIEELKCEVDMQRRAHLLEEAEEILQKEVPMIWLVNKVHYHTYRPDLKGLCFDHRGIPDLRFAYFE